MYSNESKKPTRVIFPRTWNFFQKKLLWKHIQRQPHESINKFIFDWHAFISSPCIVSPALYCCRIFTQDFYIFEFFLSSFCFFVLGKSFRIFRRWSLRFFLKKLSRGKKTPVCFFGPHISKTRFCPWKIEFSFNNHASLPPRIDGPPAFSAGARGSLAIVLTAI